MDDLRTDYNARKDKFKFNPLFWWKRNKSTIYSILGIGAICLIIFYPSLVGAQLGTWFELLFGAFFEQITITASQFIGLIVSIVIFIYLYKYWNKF